MLPDIDGYEVCKKIREFSHCPILFLSSKNNELDKILGLAVVGDDYVTKPFSPKEIAYRVKAQLRRAEKRACQETPRAWEIRKAYFRIRCIISADLWGQCIWKV